MCMSEALLSDLPNFKRFIRFSDDLLEVLRGFEQEQFEDWSRDILNGLANPKSGIRLVRGAQMLHAHSVNLSGGIWLNFCHGCFSAVFRPAAE